MNKPLVFFLLLYISSISCTEPELDSPKKKVQFNIIVTSTTVAGGRSKEEIPNGTLLRIGFHATGSSDMTFEMVEILKMGDHYITAPLELHRGNYTLTDFMLVDANGEILFLVPQKGSPLAPAVLHPLPYRFNVDKNEVTNLPMEVISAENQVPEAFGYVSFNVDVVYPFRISVSIYEDGKFALTSAQLTISDNDEKYSYDVSPKINLFSFKGDRTKDYTLTVVKEGYEIVTQRFNYNEYITKPRSAAVQVMLYKSSDLFYIKTGSLFQFGIDLRVSKSDTMMINWGDGNTEKIFLIADEQNMIFHPYSNTDEYKIDIAGELSSIYGVVINSPVVEIATHTLDNLQSLLLTHGFVPVLDLQKNVALETLWFFTQGTASEVKLPDTHFLQSLNLSYSSITNIDAVISNLYKNSVDNDLNDGSLWLDNLKPPHLTEAGINQVQLLHQHYGWSTSYTPIE